MLDDDHIEGIERRGRGTTAIWLAVHEIMDHVGTDDRIGVFEHPHDARLVARRFRSPTEARP